MGVPVLGSLAVLARIDFDALVVAVGDNGTRAAITASPGGSEGRVCGGPPPFGAPWPAVSPSATVDGLCRGDRQHRLAHWLRGDPQYGLHRRPSHRPSATSLHVAPGVHMGGEVEDRRVAFIGIGAVVLPASADRRGQHRSGAGAVVTRDVPAGVTVTGAPARIVPPRLAVAGTSPRFASSSPHWTPLPSEQPDDHEPHLPLAARRRRHRARAPARGVRLQLDRAARARTSTRSSASSPKRSACRTRRRCRAARRRCTSRCSLLGVGPGDEVLTLDAHVRRHGQRRSPTSAPRPVFIDVSPDTWTMDPDLLEEELREPRRARPAAGRGDRRRPLRPVRRLRPDPRGLRALRRAAHRGRRRGARRHLRRAAGRLVRRVRGVLVQRQQDHHHQRRRHAGLGPPRPHRPRPPPGHPGPRAGAALRALGRSATTTGSATCWPRSAAASCRCCRRKIDAAPRDQRALPRALARPARARASCRRRPTAARTAG